MIPILYLSLLFLLTAASCTFPMENSISLPTASSLPKVSEESVIVKEKEKLKEILKKRYSVCANPRSLIVCEGSGG